MGCDYKNAVRLRIANVDHSQVSAALSLPDGDSGSIPTWPILARIREHFFNFVLAEIMMMNVRQPGVRVEIKPDFHAYRI
jgi:hypothetical protein